MPEQMSTDAWKNLLVDHSRLLWGDEQTRSIQPAIAKAAKHLSVLMGVAFEARTSTPYGVGGSDATDGAES